MELASSAHSFLFRAEGVLPRSVVHYNNLNWFHSLSVTD